MRQTCRLRPYRLFFGIWLAICLLNSASAAAASLASIVRKVAHVADDMPVNKIDDVAGELVSSGAGRRLLKKTGVPVDDVVERSRAVQRLLRDAVGEADPALFKHIDAAR